jgi:hypothetical protein
MVMFSIFKDGGWNLVKARLEVGTFGCFKIKSSNY